MKRTISIFIFIIISNNCFSEKVNVAGFFVSNNGDTTECRYKIPIFRATNGNITPDYSILQRKAKAKLTDGSRIRLKPRDIQSYSFYYIFGQFNMLSVSDNFRLTRFIRKDPMIFLHLDCDGYMRLFSFYRKRTFYFGGQFVTVKLSFLTSRNCIQKGDSKIIMVRRGNFKKEIYYWFNDCPGLQEKINRDYSFISFYGLVDEYNHCRDSNK